MATPPEAGAAPVLRRNLSLTLVVLYGLGVTVGAGIYVLVGEVAARAGLYAPMAFILAALAMVGPAASYAELSGRMPFAAGQVHYVEEGLRWPPLAFAAGLAVAFIGAISAAAIAAGAAGYMAELIALPRPLLVAGVIIAMGAVAALGIRESLSIAALLTLIEIGGLLAVVAGGAWIAPQLFETARTAAPAVLDSQVWASIVSASLLGFFAFIGFENIVNMAEETHEPSKTLPRAIFITLGLTTLLYVAVVLVCVLAVPQAELARQDAPLALVFQRVTGWPPLAITLIAIAATLNGVIAQTIMASRVLYGLAAKGYIPAIVGKVHPRSQTPIYATALVTGLVLVLGLLFPIGDLAEWTSRVTLMVTSLVCGALIAIKLRGTPAPAGTCTVSIWFPIFGLLASLGLLILTGV